MAHASAVRLGCFVLQADPLHHPFVVTVASTVSARRSRAPGETSTTAQR
jgi:hypothetical protein